MTSAYTSIDVTGCTEVASSEEEAWVVFNCAGLADVPVEVAESDLRAYISYGSDAANEKAARQSFPQFNTTGDTLEWRLRDGVPVATILRFYLDRSEGGLNSAPAGQILVVTQLGTGRTCHIAYVDATANPGANELAREAADRLAGTVDCEQTDPEIVGQPGMLARD